MQEQANKRPRICQVLGVEVEERFRVDYPKGMTAWLHINEDGFVEREGGANRFKIGNSVVWAVNHPDRIIRKPRFTREEVAAVEDIRRIFGRDDTIKRTEAGVLCYGHIIINGSLLPSLRPGQTVTLEDIIV